MAVADIDPTAMISATQTLTLTRALFTTGANIGALKADVAVAAADDDNSIYRLFTDLDPRLRPLILLIGCTAITNGTDYNVGIFTRDGAVIDDNVFADALDLSSALPIGLTSKDGLSAVLAADHGKMLYEHAGHTTENMHESYDIAATGIAVGTAAGTISALLIYALPAE